MSTPAKIWRNGRWQTAGAPPFPAPPEPWVRPADWLPFPTISPGGQIFAGLYAIHPRVARASILTFEITAGGAGWVVGYRAQVSGNIVSAYLVVDEVGIGGAVTAAHFEHEFGGSGFEETEYSADSNSNPEPAPTESFTINVLSVGTVEVPNFVALNANSAPAGPIVATALNAGGTGWAVGDTFTLNDAEGAVLSIDGAHESAQGAIATSALDAPGTGWAVGDQFNIGNGVGEVSALDAASPTCSGGVASAALADGGTNWAVGDTFALNDAEGEVLTIDEEHASATGAIASSSLADGGVGWAVNDTFNVGDATGQVTAKKAYGPIATSALNSGGSGYRITGLTAAKGTIGAGASEFTVDTLTGGAASGPIATYWENFSTAQQSDISGCVPGDKLSVGMYATGAGVGLVAGSGAELTIDTVWPNGFPKTIHLSNPGTGYKPVKWRLDAYYVVQPSTGAGVGDRAFMITSVDGGGSAVGEYTITTNGAPYLVANNVATTSASGSGFTIDITAVTAGSTGPADTYSITSPGTNNAVASDVLATNPSGAGTDLTIDVLSINVLKAPVATFQITAAGTNSQVANAIAASSPSGAGAGLTIDVLSIDVIKGPVAAYSIADPGTDNAVASSVVCSALSGTGADLLVNVLSINALKAPVATFQITNPGISNSAQSALEASADNSENGYGLLVDILEVDAAPTDYVVDWGDGTTDTVAGGSKATHEYLFSEYDAAEATLSERGYKQAVVTLTPFTGADLTRIMTDAHPREWINDAQWLDQDINAPALTELGISSNWNIGASQLERVRIRQNAITYMSYLFYELFGLQVAQIDEANYVTSASGILSGCRSIRSATMPSMPECTELSYGCSGCSALEKCVGGDYPKLLYMAGFFADCEALKQSRFGKLGGNGTGVDVSGIVTNSAFTHFVAGDIDITGSGLGAMFSNNAAPIYIKLGNLIGDGPVAFGSVTGNPAAVQYLEFRDALDVTSFANLCANLNGMRIFKMGDAPACLDLSYAWSDCAALESFIHGNISGALNTANDCLSYCRSLINAPLLDTSQVIDFSNMLSNNGAMRTVPALDLSAGTQLGGMFSYDRALAWCDAFGAKADISFENCNLGGPALVNVLDKLGIAVVTESVGSQVNIAGNPGTPWLTDTQLAVARNKGWRVYPFDS